MTLGYLFKLLSSYDWDEEVTFKAFDADQTIYKSVEYSGDCITALGGCGRPTTVCLFNGKEVPEEEP